MSLGVSVIFGKTKMNLEIHWQYFLALSPELLPLIFWKNGRERGETQGKFSEGDFYEGKFFFFIALFVLDSHLYCLFLIFNSQFQFILWVCNAFFTFQMVLNILLICTSFEWY